MKAADISGEVLGKGCLAALGGRRDDGKEKESLVVMREKLIISVLVASHKKFFAMIVGGRDFFPRPKQVGFSNCRKLEE